ncbi:hypothetical protein [Sphingopyxis sp.]|uniref:hypothetical protein n=1 Tax=Sphingopyxis sp. TaxID=1908224 RepID=UPI002D785B03|nr:hypothetical protein [Sphingopyxis sp.]HET6526757.1 hypothetical protein [Sphingopyxis sp.]
MNAILAGIGFIGLFVLGIWLVGRDRVAPRAPRCDDGRISIEDFHHRVQRAEQAARSKADPSGLRP